MTSSALAWALPAAPSHAQDATWLASPGSGDFNTGANWDTGTTPTGTAYFGATNNSNLFTSVTTIGGWTFNAGAPAYTFNNNGGWFIQFNGAGITVHGGSVAIINDTFATLSFYNSSTAGTATITNNFNGYTNFYGTSTAGNASITNSASLSFYNSSTAGSASITNNLGVVGFLDSSTAGTATIISSGGLSFYGSSTAGSASITANGGTTFSDHSTAGSASITINYYLYFNNNSTAGSAALLNNVGALIDFSNTTGLIGDHKVSAGSIAGAGSYNLGANELTVGSNNLSTEVSGVIAGTGGSLVKVGTGTLTLSGNNTYTGGTTINGGTLQLGNAVGIMGSILGAITVGSGAKFGVFGADTSGITSISNGGNSYFLNNTSAGSATITNNTGGNLYFYSFSTAGGATINNNGGGTLTFNDTSTAGSATITNNGQLTFYGHTTAVSATITNSGTVLFDGDSTPGAARLINTTAGADINFYTPGLNSDGKISAGSIEGSGRFHLNGSELTVGSNNLSTNVTGVLDGDGSITGNSLIKTGTGKLTLSGNNTYTGATIVNGGTLAVNDSITSSSGVAVNNGGTLGGTGVVGNTTINSGGRLLGGTGTAGTSLAISGNLAFQSGAYYLVEVNPATASSVNVAGSATLGGATVNAVFAPGSYVARQYTILTAGSLTGTFGSLVDTTLPSNFHTELSYDATHAYLDLILSFIAPPGSGLSGNQRNVGNAIIHSFNSNGGISLVYSRLTAAGLTQASGETATGSQQTTFQAMGQFMGLLTDPFSSDRKTDASAPQAYADSAPAGAARDAYAMLAKAPTLEQRWSVWAAGFGGSQTTDGNAAQGSNSATSRLFGTAAGAEYAFSPQTQAGFALAGGGTSFSVTGGGTGRSDLFQAGAYVRHTNGPSYISAALAYGWQDVTTDRSVTLAGVDHLRAEFNANAWSGRLEGGYRFIAPWAGGIGLTPYAAGQFTTFDLPAYAETVVSGSNAFALAYAAESVTDTRSELGLRTDKSFAMASGILTLRGRAAWAHDFNPDRIVAATFQALPGASFVVNGARPAADSALTTASAEIKWRNGWSAAASFEGEFSSVTRLYAGKGVVRYAW